MLRIRFLTAIALFALLLPALGCGTRHRCCPPRPTPAFAPNDPCCPNPGGVPGPPPPVGGGF